MKVDILIASFSQGGAQRQCAWLVNELSRDSELDVRLIYLKDGVNIEIIDRSNVKMVHLKNKSLYNVFNVIKLIKLIRKRKPDIVFSWLHAADVTMGLAYPFICKKTKWAIAERDSSYPVNWRYRLRNRIGLQADAIISNSTEGKQFWVSNGQIEDKLFVVENILSPDINLLNSKNKKFDILYAGRLEKQKNIIVLAQAFCMVAKNRPDLKIGIFGDGSLKHAVEQVLHDHGSPNNITIHSYSNNILNVFNSTSIFVNISLHEGLPNTVIENIALGNTVVASRIPSHLRLLGIQYPHLIADYTNAEAVSKEIERAAASNKQISHYDHANKILFNMSPKIVANSYKFIFSIIRGKA